MLSESLLFLLQNNFVSEFLKLAYFNHSIFTEQKINTFLKSK